MTELIFVVYVALSGYNAGVLWAMQLMHYPLYAFVGAGEFQSYIVANNRGAVFAAILPAVANIVFAALLLWKHPASVPSGAPVIALALALGVLASSLAWQAGIHTQLAHDGKSLDLINKLVQTNWVRTALDTLQLVLAMWMTVRVLRAV